MKLAGFDFQAAGFRFPVAVMSDSSSSSITTSGRIVRAALVIFPVGTILFGIASFGFWWYQKQVVEDRSQAYASALRRDMSAQAMDRYVSILREVFQQPESERLPAVASFVESSMSPENMGYEPLRDRFFHGSLEVSNVEAELTGRQRPREVHLILVPYGNPARLEAEAHALAGMMSLANAMTGERTEITRRFAALPLGVQDQAGLSALERLAKRMTDRAERLLKVTVLGGADDAVMSQVSLTFRAAQNGVAMKNIPATSDTPGTLAAMSMLKTQL